MPMTTPGGTIYLTTYVELAEFHLGKTDTVACTCPRHKTPFIAIDRRACQLFAEFRRLGGRPRQVASSTRCEAHQRDLIDIYGGTSPVAKDPKTATHSAVMHGGVIVKPCFAFDIRNDGSQAAKIADRDQMRQAGMNLWGKRPRIGWEGYGFGLIHADVAFFAPTNPNHVSGVEW